MTWNRDLEAAPRMETVLVATEHLDTGETRTEHSYRYSSGNWHCEDWWAVRVIAWMPMPDPAPLSEDHAKEEGK